MNIGNFKASLSIGFRHAMAANFAPRALRELCPDREPTEQALAGMAKYLASQAERYNNAEQIEATITRNRRPAGARGRAKVESTGQYPPPPLNFRARDFEHGGVSRWAMLLLTEIAQ